MYKFNPLSNNFDIVSNSIIGDDYIVYVSSLSNLPTPIGTTITLNTGKLYYFLRMVDCSGYDIVIGESVLQGISQELSGISNCNILVNDTCTIRDFRFDNVEVIIDAPLGAFDWNTVNFFNTTKIEIKNADNIVWSTFGFINTYGVVITGTINSLIIAPNCIWRSINEPTAILFEIASTAIINRRIRIQDSVFSTDFPSQIALKFNIGATIGIESLILKTIRFIGLGTSITGINGNDDRCFFFEAVGGGVINSTAVANMYMKNNTIPTVVTIGNRFPMAGITELGPVFQRFIHNPIENYLEYTSSVSRIFAIRALYTIFSGSNNVVGVYIGITRAGNLRNPDVDRITESEMYSTTNGTRPENAGVQAVVTLNQGDRIYCILQNTSANVDILIQFFNLIVEKTAT